MMTTVSIRSSINAVVAATALLVVGAPALGAPLLVTDRVTLGGTDFIDWGTLGPSFTSVANPFIVTSNGGVTFDVSKPLTGDFQIREQSNGWAGNFAPGDMVLYANNLVDTFNPISLSGAGGETLFAAGAQIQQDFFGAFTAFIEVFDAFDVSLGSFSLAGNSSSAGDNSAIFIGIADPDGFSKVSIGIQSGTSIGSFAINQFDFTMADIPRVPEPGTLTLFGLGLAGIGLLRRRRQAEV